MPQPTKGARLGGSPAHQRLILANLATSLFQHGKITHDGGQGQAPAAVRRAADHQGQAGRPAQPPRDPEADPGPRDRAPADARDRPVLRRPQRRLHAHHQDAAAPGRQRPHGRDRAGVAEDGHGRGGPRPARGRVAGSAAVRRRPRLPRHRLPPRTTASEETAADETAADESATATAEPTTGSATEVTADRNAVDEAEGSASEPVSDRASETAPSPRSTPRVRRPPARRPRRARAALWGRGASPDLNVRHVSKPASSPSGAVEPAVREDGGLVAVPAPFPGAPAPPAPVRARFRLDIAYDGTDFSGWAVQPGRRTVAGVLIGALTAVLRGPVMLTVAGRTDAGVHATGQVASADLPDDLDPAWLLRRLARMLPADVRVTAVTAVPPEFDARFAALRRHYRYRIATAAWGADPLRARDTLAWPHPLDLDAVSAASAALLGEHDFAAFCKRREGATTVRALQRLDWTRGAGRGRRGGGVGRRVLPLDGAQPGRGAARRRARSPRRRLARRAAAATRAGVGRRRGARARADPRRRRLPAGRELAARAAVTRRLRVTPS